ncbi:MAG: type II secretion system protein, partial [Planctomycetota bacterium]
MKSCPNRWKAVSAFTLVELMVTMAILVILVGFMVTIVRTSMRTWETSE